MHHPGASLIRSSAAATALPAGVAGIRHWAAKKPRDARWPSPVRQSANTSPAESHSRRPSALGSSSLGGGSRLVEAVLACCIRRMRNQHNPQQERMLRLTTALPQIRWTSTPNASLVVRFEKRHDLVTRSAIERTIRNEIQTKPAAAVSRNTDDSYRTCIKNQTIKAAFATAIDKAADRLKARVQATLPPQ